MTKFFRRHSRIFLLMFMAVLMVVFVIGDAIDRGAGGGGQLLDEQVGTAHGSPVRQSDLRTAGADLDIAATVGMLPAGLEQLRYLAVDETDMNLTVHLLSREAQNMGISVSEAQIKQLLEARGVQDAHFDLVRERFRLSRDGVFNSLRRMMAVNVMFQTQLESALSVPMPQLQLAYRDQAQKASVKVSIIDAEPFLDQIDPPTEDQLVAHFEAGKDRETAHTPEALAHGYRLPNRIKLEYITVDPSTIEDLVMIREADAVRFFEANKSRYQKEVAGPASIATSESETVPQTYEEARERVREAVRSLEAIREAQRLINAARSEALQSWSAAQSSQETESFESLAARLSTQFQLDWQSTEWIERGDFVTIPVLGGASLTRDGRRVPAYEAAFYVDGLEVDASQRDEEPLKLNQPSDVFVTYRVNATGKSEPYQAVFFRVVGVKAAAPPDSLDEVREQVVEDVMMQAAFDRAAEAANALADSARQSGLDEAVAQAEELRAVMFAADESGADSNDEAAPARLANRTGFLEKLTPIEPPNFGRFPTMIRGVRSQLLNEQLFDSELMDSADAHRTVVVPAADKHAWLVAELLELKPLYAGEFETARDSLEQRAARTKLSSFQFEWCRPENVKKRTGYVELANDPETTDLAGETEAS